MSGRITESLTSATASAPPAEAHIAASAKPHVQRGTPTLRTMVTAAEEVPVNAANLFVARTAAAGMPVVDISTGMSTRPPPPMTASIQPAVSDAISRATIMH